MTRVGMGEDAAPSIYIASGGTMLDLTMSQYPLGFDMSPSGAVIGAFGYTSEVIDVPSSGHFWVLSGQSVENVSLVSGGFVRVFSGSCGNISAENGSVYVYSSGTVQRIRGIGTDIYLGNAAIVTSLWVSEGFTEVSPYVSVTSMATLKGGTCTFLLSTGQSARITDWRGPQIIDVPPNRASRYGVDFDSTWVNIMSNGQASPVAWMFYPISAYGTQPPGSAVIVISKLPE